MLGLTRLILLSLAEGEPSLLAFNVMGNVVIVRKLRRLSDE